jgi:hypothetical protein
MVLDGVLVGVPVRVDVVEAVDEELAVPETVPDAVMVAVPDAVFVLLVVESAVTEEEAVTVGV